MNTEQKHTLLPCPFCGGKAKEYERFNSNTVTCLVCGVKVRQSEMGHGDASERWKRRAALQSQYREDAYRLDWLQQSDGRFFKLLHITSIVGRGFSPTNSNGKWFPSLRDAIDHARRVEGMEISAHEFNVN